MPRRESKNHSFLLPLFSLLPFLFAKASGRILIYVVSFIFSNILKLEALDAKVENRFQSNGVSHRLFCFIMKTLVEQAFKPVILGSSSHCLILAPDCTQPRGSAAVANLTST
ncbi:hypothetical protein Droror1_Dr00023065 [Drosera rotundifolia]